MRMEDLDGPRVKPEADRQALKTLVWLGLDHDGDVLHQSHDLTPYRQAMATLAAMNLVYACDLTRSQIAEAVTAPHVDDHETTFPVELRATDPAAFAFGRDNTNYRLVVPDESIEIADEIADASTFNPAREVGDFVVWTKRGVPGYQLAVVVDDIRQGVTDVVRGDDLLRSAARQALIYRALGATPPRWWHAPLVLGPDGRRLAKRHGDTRIETYRRAGVPAERIIGLLGYFCGVSPSREPMTAETFRESFELARLDREPVTFTPEDHQWLMCGASSP